jgi:DNA-binding XRE family transcriptional regulator
MRRPPLTRGLILAWADRHRKATGKWPAVTSGRVLGARGENWRSVNNALRYGLRGMPGGSSLALFLAEHRGARNQTNLPLLTVQQILSWADRHRERTGHWPTMRTGAVVDAPEETWDGIDQALHNGHRGLPGGDSLARLLVRHRGARNHTSIPPLSIPQILAWADAHHERTGAWPNRDSGPIPESPGDTWDIVDQALQVGRRGLEGGMTLHRLLREGVRPLKVKGKGPGRARFRINFPQEVIARYRAGDLTVESVADLCGVSHSVASRELLRTGLPPHPPGRRPDKRPALHREVIRRSRRGENVAHIATAVGLSRQGVDAILRQYHVVRNLFRTNMGQEDRRRLAARLKDLRAAAGLTQEDLATRAGLSESTVWALENARTPPNRKTLTALAKALKVNPEDLLGSS